jgi:hypothetical protein
VEQLKRRRRPQAAPPSSYDDSHVLIPPPEYLDATRRVLDFIQLDPCSTAACQKVIGAHAWFKASNAAENLDEPWSGRVFLHAHPDLALARQQLQKLLHEYLAGRVDAAIILAGRGDWLRQEPLLLSFPWLIHYKRMAHRRVMPGGSTPFTPTHNTISHYLPARQGFEFDEDRLALFVEAFSPFGRIVLAEQTGRDWTEDALIATARMPVKPVLPRTRLDRHNT